MLLPHTPAPQTDTDCVSSDEMDVREEAVKELHENLQKAVDTIDKAFDKAIDGEDEIARAQARREASLLKKASKGIGIGKKEEDRKTKIYRLANTARPDFVLDAQKAATAE